MAEQLQPAPFDRCRDCDSPLRAGATYCTQCGMPTVTAAADDDWIEYGIPTSVAGAAPQAIDWQRFFLTAALGLLVALILG